MIQVTLALASLGLTKNDAINAALGVITRRVYATNFNEGHLMESITDELRRFFGSKDYRKIVSGVGKKTRRHVLGGANVMDALSGLADEHSVGLRTIRDNLEYGDESQPITDDVVEGFFGDVVTKIVDFVQPGLLGEDSEPETPSETTTLTESLLSGFRNLGQHMSVEDVFPDAHEHLTYVDNDKPWLPRKS